LFIVALMTVWNLIRTFRNRIRSILTFFKQCPIRENIFLNLSNCWNAKDASHLQHNCKIPHTNKDAKMTFAE